MCLKKRVGGGEGVCERAPEQAHLAGQKECQLNGGKGLRSIIMEIIYS